MDAELRALEDKINQMAALCQRLRTENVQLRQDLAASVNENRRLSEKIALAASRLEGVLARIPEIE
jgi:cell division protein ZapB